jgi:cyclopropane fatty-acyl-phospholipid synthase-like methyltransferase
VTRDWHAWHGHYDDPASSLSRRLEVVRERLRAALDERAAVRGADGLRLVSMCAGDGRDTLPVLAAGYREVDALLVELDEDLTATARRTAAELGLDRVEVRTANAGSTDAYEGWQPADVLMACGVFGNVTDADIRRTVAVVPMLLAADALVIWTRGRHANDVDPSEVDGDPSEYVRALFSAGEFDEVEFVRPTDAGFRVGVHRFVGAPQAYATGQPMFAFV